MIRLPCPQPEEKCEDGFIEVFSCTECGYEIDRLTAFLDRCVVVAKDLPSGPKLRGIIGSLLFDHFPTLEIPREKR